MRNFTFSFIIMLNSIISILCAQNDSLIRYKDLQFHSEFEKTILSNPSLHSEFNLCLATDKSITQDKSQTLNQTFSHLTTLIKDQKTGVNNVRQKFKKIHKILFFKAPLLYNENAEFADILSNGYFNFLTSSALFTLALNELKIPLYFIYTLNKTDVVVNPNGAQTIFESENKKDENGYYNSTGSNIYLLNLLPANFRIGSEYAYNSQGGASNIQFKTTDLIAKNQIASTIYFNKAIVNYNSKKIDEAFNLMQKACYLYPSEPFITTFYNFLIEKISKCSFRKVEDVDMVVQLSRFNIDNYELIKSIYIQTLRNFSEMQNDLELCTKAYNRLIPEIKNPMLADEISFNYYLYSAYHKSNINNIAPIIKAMKIRPNDKNVNALLESHISSIRYSDDDREAALDTLLKFQKELSEFGLSPEINNEKLLLYLSIAQEYFSKNDYKAGMSYITQFESEYNQSLYNSQFRVGIENCYYEYAMYFRRRNNIKSAQKVVDKGMQYVPNSSVIKSATEGSYSTQPKVIKRTMTKSEYERYLKNKIVEIK